MIRTIIIDDEFPSRETLKNYLRDYCPVIQVVGEADSMKTGLEAIHLLQPDLLFLDVEMPNGNGFDLLRNLDRVSFKIIFVTAHSDYAVRAFRFFASDYLLKPVDILQLKEAVEKVRQEKEKEIQSRNLEELIKYVSSREHEISNIVIPDKKGFTVIDLQDILYCEADSYCTHFHLTDDRRITSSKNLKVYDDLLAEKGFQRVHNSYLVNLHHVKSFDHEGIITLTGKHSVPLGNTYRKRFAERICRFND